MAILTLAAAGVLAAAGCGGGSAPATAGGGAASSAPAGAATDPAPSSAPASGGGETTAVAIQGFAFVPADVTVAAGTTVTWTNDDQAPHTVKWSDDEPESEQLDQGGTYERTFDTAGTFDYVCGIHPNMTGSVTVTE